MYTTYQKGGWNWVSVLGNRGYMGLWSDVMSSRCCMWFLELHAKVVGSEAAHVPLTVWREAQQIMINKHASRRLSFFTRSLFSQTFVLGVIPLSGIDQRHSPYHARQTKGDLQWNLLWDAGRGFENCTGPAMQCFKWIWEYIKIITGV